jgi:hypothetical protein
LLPGNKPRFPLYRRLGGLENSSEGSGKETFLSLLGTEPGFPACSINHIKYTTPATKIYNMSFENTANFRHYGIKLRFIK